MCLSEITETGLDLIGKGYKVVAACDAPWTKIGMIYFEPIKRDWYIAKNKEQLDPNHEITSSYIEFSGKCRRYSCGFHIFSSIEDAKLYGSICLYKVVIIQVEYEKGHTTGIQEFTGVESKNVAGGYPYYIYIKSECIVASRIKYGKILLQKNPSSVNEWIEYKEQPFLESA